MSNPRFSQSQRKVITFIGCGLIHLVLFNQVVGTIYCTGNIMPYIASYIGMKTGYSPMSSFSAIFYICVFSWSFVFQPAIYLQNHLTPKK
jgi:uncharacterized membrane protein